VLVYFYKITQRHNPKGSVLHNHSHEHIKRNFHAFNSENHVKFWKIETLSMQRCLVMVITFRSLVMVLECKVSELFRRSVITKHVSCVRTAMHRRLIKTAMGQEAIYKDHMDKYLQASVVCVTNKKTFHEVPY
jgi:hypothetical protein